MSEPALTGSCHCGALSVDFQPSKPVGELWVRACQCTFCLAHAALSVTDPGGMMTLRASDPRALVRYNFGLRLADFILCSRCGVYLGAYMEHEGRGYGVLNLNVLAARKDFRAPEPMDYDGETPEQRLKRRAERWTPARLVTV